ncbi:somatostatin receptor type 2-like isoform X2 [Clavelina lepadiformis]
MINQKQSYKMTETNEELNAMGKDEITKQTLYNVENVLYPAITVFGILANTFVITVVLIWERSRPNRTVANMFVVNLAIADVLFLFILPFYMPAIIETRGWIYGSFICKLFAVIKNLNYRASISFLTTMSVDRFLAIVFPLESRGYRTRRNAIKVCVVLWLLSLASTIPLMLYTDVRSTHSLPVCQEEFPGYESTGSVKDLYDYFNFNASDYNLNELGGMNEPFAYGNNERYLDENSGSSDPHKTAGSISPADYDYSGDANEIRCLHKGHENSQSFKAWVYSGFVFYFLLPVLITLFCYFAIIRVAINRDVTSNKPKGAHHQVAITVAVLVSVFVGCWLPFQIFELLQMPPGVKVNNVNDCSIIEYSFTLLAWLNSAINPILYSISSKRFRDKAMVAWAFIRYGQSRALAMQASQRTMQTRLQTLTAMGTSTKSMTVPATPRTETKMEFRPISTALDDEDAT